MKTTAKDVILLCKGWYDKEKYPTILDALKQYYRKNYSDQFEDQLNEKFLLRIVLQQVMYEIVKYYPDRLIGLINIYLFSDNVFHIVPDENNHDYDYRLFYKINYFLCNLKMRGNGFINIDTSDYLEEYTDDENNHKFRLKEDII